MCTTSYVQNSDRQRFSAMFTDKNLPTFGRDFYIQIHGLIINTLNLKAIDHSDVPNKNEELTGRETAPQAARPVSTRHFAAEV
jgi:hypothetical protein